MEIREIKARLTLQLVLAHYNLKPDRNKRLCCPWHDDKTPSLQIYEKTNTWTCFSSNCDAGSGDQIDFILRYEQITKHEALNKAAQLAGEVIETTSSKIEVSKDLARVAVLTKFYQGSLHGMAQSTNAQAYTEKRGLDWKVLEIGFVGYDAHKTWSKDFKVSAEKLGLMKIRNCLIFPLKDREGQIVNVYGRSIADNYKVRHFYLQGKHRGLYGFSFSIEKEKLILTESIIDAATVHQYLQQGVLAMYGTNGFTTEHESLIKSLKSLEEVILFFDGDGAGKGAVKKWSKKLHEIIPKLTISYVATPQGEDVNSLAVQYIDEAATVLQTLFDQRITLYPLPKIEEPKQQLSMATLDVSNVELIKYHTDASGQHSYLQVLILGGIKITGMDRMRVTLKITRKDNSSEPPIRSSLDLYNDKQVDQLTSKIADHFDTGSSKATQLIADLTDQLEQYRMQRAEAMRPKPKQENIMREAEKTKAVQYLKSKRLLQNTLKDIKTSGIVGEDQNALIAYLAYTSRKREKPLHIMCLGASATGKTYLQEKVSQLIPEEERIEITSLSDNAFYYFGREELKHKLILIEDLDGAENVMYPLRELQSKRRISKTVTLKDNKGNLKTVSLRVEGPVCVSGCTTRERIYEDNANRCILLYIDDSEDQDKRIMAYQQKASAGAIDSATEEKVIGQLQHVQRLLKPIKVVNPYAEYIDLPSEVFKPRRTLLLLLSFIETITFYHQWQRSVRTDGRLTEQYIESTVEDVEWGFRMMKEVLFNKSDELSKATRQFLERLKIELKPGEVFYTQDIRKQYRLSSSTIHRYIRELQINGYIKWKGGNKFKGYEYEVVDYEEYKQLKSKIDERLETILLKIKQKGLPANSVGVPVSHKYPSSENGISKPLETSALT